MYPAKITDLHPSVRLRVAIERRIVRLLVEEFAAQGFVFLVDEGSIHTDFIPCANTRQVLTALMNCEDDQLGIVKNGHILGWIWLVYGNDGWDVICDYHASLEQYMPKTLALIEKIQEAE